MRILIIEDDTQLCRTLAYRLKKEESVRTAAMTAETAWQLQEKTHTI